MLRHLAVIAVVFAALVAASSASAQQRAVPTSANQIRLSFAPVVERVAPAVVNVYTRKTVRQRAPTPFFDDPFFRRFFGESSPLFGMPRERIERSLGSGVIVGADGTIVTNNHVIEGADEITVVLNDRREFAAEVVGLDDRTDLAVLRIDSEGETLPHLELGDSDAVAVGDIVLAVGNPFGVGQTVTSGIVSALARTNVGVSDFQSFIQTDAAINPGNSGGALVTIDGQLVGINTAIFSRSGGSIGIGFAIPSSLVRAVVRGLVNGGRIARPWLGVTSQTVTADLAASLGLKRPVGVLVNHVHPASPASDAGIGVGDVILSVDGHEIADEDGLRFRIATAEVGARLRVAGIFDGRRDEREVRLIAPPERPARDTTVLEGRHPLAGATVANLNPALADEIGADLRAQGVVVLDVARGSPAQRLGLQKGDVLVTVAGESVTDVKNLSGIIGTSRRAWEIAVRRGDQVLSVVVQG